jgi:hypothetical protein
MVDWYRIAGSERGHRTVASEPVDAALDDVILLMDPRSADPTPLSIPTRVRLEIQRIHPDPVAGSGS